MVKYDLPTFVHPSIYVSTAIFFLFAYMFLSKKEEVKSVYLTICIEIVKISPRPKLSLKMAL